MAERSRLKALPLLARTANTASEQYRDDFSDSGIVYFNISAASGTGGVKVQIRGYDGDNNAVVFFESAVFIATGVRTYVFGQGSWTAALGITAIAQVPLPQIFDVNVVVADASSYTYSVTVETF